jgi:hypothetical protein
MTPPLVLEWDLRYTAGSTDEEAASVVNEVTEMLQASLAQAKFVAAAVFRGMQGIWTLKRMIDTHRSGSLGGTFIGSAHFHPRVPTDSTYSAEYLYIEEGTFKMDNGASFPATRRYIYRYNEATDAVTAWFVDEDGKSVATLFNTWAPRMGGEGLPLVRPRHLQEHMRVHLRRCSVTKF